MDEIKAIFKQHVKSEIKFEPVPERILYKNHSVYTGNDISTYKELYDT